MFVCLSAPKLHGRSAPNFCACCLWPFGSVHLWWRCDRRSTSGFVDEIMECNVRGVQYSAIFVVRIPTAFSGMPINIPRDRWARKHFLLNLDSRSMWSYQCSFLYFLQSTWPLFFFHVGHMYIMSGAFVFYWFLKRNFKRSSACRSLS